MVIFEEVCTPIIASEASFLVSSMARIFYIYLIYIIIIIYIYIYIYNYI